MKNRVLTGLRSNRNNGRTVSAEVEDNDEGLADLPRQWLASAESVIGDHPAISLAVALSAGVMIGWLIKRR